MEKYMLCLSEQYIVELGNTKSEYINNLETMLDNLVDLLQYYGIDDNEIFRKIKEDTTIKIEKCE